MYLTSTQTPLWQVRLAALRKPNQTSEICLYEWLSRGAFENGSGGERQSPTNWGETDGQESNFEKASDIQSGYINQKVNCVCIVEQTTREYEMSRLERSA